MSNDKVPTIWIREGMLVFFILKLIEANTQEFGYSASLGMIRTWVDRNLVVTVDDSKPGQIEIVSDWRDVIETRWRKN